MKPDTNKFTEELRFRCPPRLSPMIDHAAERRFMKTSEYIRQAIVERLRADGLEFGETAA